MTAAADVSSRPWGMIGQDEEVRALARGVAEGRPAHAYLFAGPPGSGKGTLAKRLAQALECGEGAPDEPCRACRHCRHIESDSYPDVEFVRPGGLCAESEHDHTKDSSKDIKICQIRTLERRLSVSPFEGRYRVVIVDPADAMNMYAADAFLKTLEEPPRATVLVLLTSKEELLPETVRSRLRRVEVRPVPVAELEAALAERGLAPERAALVARLSRGCAGWALAAAADETIIETRSRLLDELVALGEAGRFERFEFAASLAGRWSKDRAGVTATLSAWAEWWRDVLLVAAGAERGILNMDRLQQIRSTAEQVEITEAAGFLRALRSAQKHLEENANPRLALDVLMLRMPESRRAGVAASAGRGRG